ncbi:MAG TPA: aminodeoxychorismate/anthranilate synthase component II [Clostridiales bacterium]|jgi:anthranilate synthase/aminodeoxychorismate synthase-like glutamine amidotransferase|nr:aminodeoxychorismate/anthranilate synthase component II [Clostridiales bacterium]HQP69718.1 aminodeoxychorismate/anthranilate synthase component II [Clostridiales bacterium]
MKILIFDNYDSFTHNLKALIRKAVKDADITIKRNRDLSALDEEFDVLVISPGPMTWKETGLLTDLFEKTVIPEKKPVLGICLGMQFIAGYFGYEITACKKPLHGSAVNVMHNSDPLFNNIPESFTAARYNSLGLEFAEDMEDGPLEMIAFEEGSGSVMAAKHVLFPIAGFQYHPESFLTEYGETLIKNFMEIYAHNK